MKDHRNTLVLALLLLLAGAGTWTAIYSLERDDRPPAAAAPATVRPPTVHGAADSGKALADRLAAARGISTDISDEELGKLIEFVSKPFDEQNRETELMAINQVMDQLRVSGLASKDYAVALCGLIRDPKIHPVVRDYAVQHAVEWMSDASHGRSPATLAGDDRRRLLDCMLSMLEEPEILYQTGYGTTLNALRSLHDEYPEEVDGIIALCAQRINAIASGKISATVANRISAIQTLPTLADRGAALELVRMLVGDTPAASPVRLVAIATLGNLGEQTDLQQLRKIQRDDSRASYAARSAAERLETNLTSSAQ